MKKLWGWIGTCIFWIFWPAWVVYFRISNRRSRVIVVYEGMVLLVQSWVGTKKDGLPGGGVHKGESLKAGAVRELYEETNIVVSESALVKLGARRNKKYHFNYTATFFWVELQEDPMLKIRPGEIYKATWMPLSSVDPLLLDDEAAYALNLYQPIEQVSLL